jgi:acyl-CoA reductase-like NAD-dependent aldehyde dehydrogenase
LLNYPGIPAVTDDRSLAQTVRALLEVVELMTGQRGTNTELVVVRKKEFDALVARVAALESP